MRLFLFICTGIFLPAWVNAQVNCRVVDLQAEYMSNPIGIDASHPRLNWKLEDTRPAAKQTAWQIIVGTDSTAVRKGTGNYWQGIQTNNDVQRTVYSGKALEPFTRYFWSVRVWDKDGKITSWSSPASFETGMMDIKNWQGAWISDSRDIHQKAAPYFRKTFSLQKKIRSARVYMASAGLQELYINGALVGDHRLDPIYTRFDRRTLYVTYDVTTQLQNGNNAIGVLLGNGWYNHQSTAVWYFHEAPWRGHPAFCLDLRITYEDGTTATIRSGKDWKTSAGPVIFNSIYTGEHYDSRLEQPGWNTAGFVDSSWKEVIYRTAPSTNIVSQSLQPIRAVEKIPAVAVKKFNDTDYVFNLGRNISGVSELVVKGKPGTVIRLRHAERLYANGHTDLSNIDVHYRPTDNTDPFATDIFILKGDGREETFMARFNYKGFQYVEVTSSEPIELTQQHLTGYFLHSDVPVAGTINASNSLINKIWSATNNSYLSNLVGYPTDCPQREKNGWTGDAHIAVETGLYNFDGITVYEKWMADHRDEQQSNGVLPSIVPSSGWGYEWGNGPDWTSTIAIIPWNLYLFYGDSKPLADCYENIRRYVNHIDELYPSGLTSWGLGDWVPVKSKSPVEFTSTAYYFTDVTILTNAARLLKKQEDYIKYQALAKKIKDAFNAKYFDSAKAIYGNGLQTELSVPLMWGLVPDNMKEKVAANLAKRVQADSVKLDVGLLGSKAILNALSENGYADIAYQLASRDTYPSWGGWVANGATTLYEDWNTNPTFAASLNHIMFGEIGAWFYKALGGIKPDAAKPGFKNILLHPYFVNGLDSFSCRHNGPYGDICSSWKRAGNKILYTVTVPANSTGTLTINVKGNEILYKEGIPTKVVGQTYTEVLPAGTWKFELR